MTAPDVIRGAVDPTFLTVRSAFEQNFAENLEVGASFCAFVDGECVVDLHGGFADQRRQTPWAENTIACIYSSGKAVLALLIARAVSDGLLDYDAPVARYWPAFAENGKEDITVAMALSHQAGLCGFAEEPPLGIWLDWDEVTKRLASMAPLWRPGTASGYHPQTIGFIAGEVLRRASGRSVGEQLRAIGGDIYCGLDDDEWARAAVMRKPPAAPDLGALSMFKEVAFLKPWSGMGRGDPREWAAAEIPSSNMHATARSLAETLYPLANAGKTVAGEDFLSSDAVAQALNVRITGDDLVLPFHLAWTPGLMANINRHFGPGENAFGHSGFGGSCVVVDPEHRLSAAYVMNKMSPHLVGDPRAVSLFDALYASL